MAVSTTHKQAQLLAYIKGFIADHDGVAQMGEAVGLASKSGVFRLIEGLEERGLLTRVKNRARAIQITPDAGILAAFPAVALLAELSRRREASARKRAA